MSDILEGIRFLDVEEGIVIPDDQIRVQVETRNLYYGEPVQNAEGWLEEIIPLKPLLKFPDKDSEGNELWAGDIIDDGIAPYLLRSGAYTWGVSPIWKEGIGDFLGASIEGFYLCYLVNRSKRLCSIFDKEAIDHLDQETIDKLKEMI